MTETTTKLTNEQVMQDLSQSYLKLKGELSETEDRRRALKNQLQQIQGAVSVLQQIEEANTEPEETSEDADLQTPSYKESNSYKKKSGFKK